MYQNFRLIKFNVDVQPFLREISEVENAWELNTGRQKSVNVQREALSIPIRGLRKSQIKEGKRRDVHESRWTNLSMRFPFVRQFLTDQSSHLSGELGRGKLVCLPPGNIVYPHIDRGEYYQRRNRYHLVLKSGSGSWLKAGDEEVRMQEGELWWFDNKQMHEARNDDAGDRIHLIFDLLPINESAGALDSVSAIQVGEV